MSHSLYVDGSVDCCFLHILHLVILSYEKNFLFSNQCNTCCRLCNKSYVRSSGWT
jgi:hypothetical protein